MYDMFPFSSVAGVVRSGTVVHDLKIAWFRDMICAGLRGKNREDVPYYRAGSATDEESDCGIR